MCCGQVGIYLAANLLYTAFWQLWPRENIFADDFEAHIDASVYDLPTFVSGMICRRAPALSIGIASPWAV